MNKDIPVDMDRPRPVAVYHKVSREAADVLRKEYFVHSQVVDKQWRYFIYLWAGPSVEMLLEGSAGFATPEEAHDWAHERNLRLDALEVERNLTEANRHEFIGGYVREYQKLVEWEGKDHPARGPELDTIRSELIRAKREHASATKAVADAKLALDRAQLAYTQALRKGDLTSNR